MPEKSVYRIVINTEVIELVKKRWKGWSRLNFSVVRRRQLSTATFSLQEKLSLAIRLRTFLPATQRVNNDTPDTPDRKRSSVTPQVPAPGWVVPFRRISSEVNTLKLCSLCRGSSFCSVSFQMLGHMCQITCFCMYSRMSCTSRRSCPYLMLNSFLKFSRFLVIRQIFIWRCDVFLWLEDTGQSLSPPSARRRAQIISFSFFSKCLAFWCPNVLLRQSGLKGV